ncbi:MAG: LAO/AO transport system kinase [Bacteroidia bacterium]|jgi:LAO/AO transport system kinase
MPNLDVNKLYKSINEGDNRALAKAITLLESTLQSHQDLGNRILDLCLKNSGNSIRIAVTGVPGVGKSTFIDAFGQYLIDEHHKKVAVLAVDPTSQRSKGSILGDKTRMNQLSVSESAFVRPSPSGDTLGGVAAQTREAILLCEAAGYDVILVETVGVGQSETLVHNMVDFFLLLLIPGAGDELQGIKRGIVEMADLVAINKSETNKTLAKEAYMHYKNALHLLQGSRQNWEVPVENIDSLSGLNLSTIYTQIERFVEVQKSTGDFEAHRKQQAVKWFYQQIKHGLMRLLDTDAALSKKAKGLADDVSQENISARSAANQFVSEILKPN